MRESFKRLPGDTSTYALGDGQGAVRLARSAPFIAVDIETGSASTVNRWKVSAVAIADEQQAFVLDPSDPGDAQAIRDCLRVARRLVFHNAAYDVPVLHVAGLMELDSIGKVHDTLVTARLAWPDRLTPNSLGSVAERVLAGGYDRLKSALADGFKAVSQGRVSKGQMFDRLGLASPAFVAYAAFDVIVTARVYAALVGALSQALNPGLPSMRAVDAGALDEREQVVNRVLLRASSVGLILDEDAVDSVIDELRVQADAASKELVAAGVDPNAHPSVVKGAILAMLDAEGRIPSSWPRLRTGGLSTDKRWIAKLEGSPLVTAAVEMLEAERFIKDYTGGTLRLTYQGRVRP
jgi:DNA polymerase III epsilon subunit-like protein